MNICKDGKVTSYSLRSGTLIEEIGIFKIFETEILTIIENFEKEQKVKVESHELLASGDLFLVHGLPRKSRIY